MMQIFYWLKGNFEEEINYKKTNRASAVIKFPEHEKQIQLLWN